MKYFINRDNPLTDTDINEIESAYSTIVEYFEKSWLLTKGSHPLQILWNRSDHLSTIELTTFGKALIKLKDIDEKWLDYQITLIKSDNISNQKGAFWEIIGSFYLIDKNVEIIPAKKNQSGFDVSIKNKQTNKIINYSLKYFSFSENHKLFLKNCEEIHLLIYSTIKTLKINNIAIFVRKHKKYPSSEDWSNLKSILVDGLKKFKNQTISFNNEMWEVILSYLSEERNNLHESYTSHTVCIISPYHKNEQSNFNSKIEDAILNLKEHRNFENENTINALFINLPRTVSMNQCDEWLDEYFKQVQEDPISSIILYQPSVNFLYKEKQTYLQHCVHITNNDNFLKWTENDKRNNVELWFLTGIGIASPHSEKLLINDKLVNLDNSYCYQQGDLYINPFKIRKGAIYEKLEKVSSGIQTHIVTKKSKSKFIFFDDSPNVLYKICKDGKLKVVKGKVSKTQAVDVAIKTDCNNYIITKPYEPVDELLIL